MISAGGIPIKSNHRGLRIQPSGHRAEGGFPCPACQSVWVHFESIVSYNRKSKMSVSRFKRFPLIIAAPLCFGMVVGFCFCCLWGGGSILDPSPAFQAVHPCCEDGSPCPMHGGGIATVPGVAGKPSLHPLAPSLVVGERISPFRSPEPLPSSIVHPSSRIFSLSSPTSFPALPVYRS
jgi:hypothetical protein